MKLKPLTLIEGNSEINSVLFYDKINRIIEEERQKNSRLSSKKTFEGENDSLKYSS